MTKKALTTATAIFALTIATCAQRKTYFGAEVAVVFDVYELVDKGEGLKNTRYENGLWGFNLRQDLNKSVFIETGLLRKYYNEGIAFKMIEGYSASNAITAWFIPLRLGTRINLHKEKISLVPVIGYSFCINSDYGYGDGGGSGYTKVTGGDSVSYNYTSNYNFVKRFPLLQTGMGLEFRLLKTALLSLSTNYYTGFKKVIQQDISYTVNNSPVQTATAFSKGDHFSFGLGLKYPVSNFWIKKK